MARPIEITDDERRVLEAFSAGVIGGPEDDCHLVAYLRPALESCKAKGLLYDAARLVDTGRQQTVVRRMNLLAS